MYTHHAPLRLGSGVSAASPGVHTTRAHDAEAVRRRWRRRATEVSHLPRSSSSSTAMQHLPALQPWRDCTHLGGEGAGRRFRRRAAQLQVFERGLHCEERPPISSALAIFLRLLTGGISLSRWRQWKRWSPMVGRGNSRPRPGETTVAWDGDREAWEWHRPRRLRPRSCLRQPIWSQTSWGV